MLMTEFTYSLSLFMITLLNLFPLSVTLFKIFGWIASLALLISLICEIVAMVIIKNPKKKTENELESEKVEKQIKSSNKVN